MKDLPENFSINNIKISTIPTIAEVEQIITYSRTQLRIWQERASSANSGKSGGGIALLIGILGLLFLSGIWYLWIFLFIIGALAYLTQADKGRHAAEEIKAWEKVVGKLNARRAELQTIPQPAPAADHLTKVQQLKTMLDQGLITAAEYETKKTAILQSM